MRHTLHLTQVLPIFLIAALMLALSPLISEKEAPATDSLLAPAATARPTDVPPTETLPAPPATATSIPLPTETGVAPASSDAGEGDKSGPQSAIEGIVTDLSTGEPGRGVKVRLNEIETLTDSLGHYSLTGLSAGEILVSLEIDPPAQLVTAPLWVSLDGQNRVWVDFQFYSQAPAPSPVVSPTLRPRSGQALTLTPPPYLPLTGGD